MKRTESGEIEEVPLEKYVMSVVAAEMPAEFEIEALKAQAIAARTYIVNHLLHQEDEEKIVFLIQQSIKSIKMKNELKATWG